MNSLGRHLLVEYYECNPGILNDVMGIENSMVGAAKFAEATVINSTFHHFSPFGVSGVVVIQESHLAIHTWPEYGYAAVDIFTCGDAVDPWICYRYLKDAFEAAYASAMEMLRGQEGLLHKVSLERSSPATGREVPFSVRNFRNVWFTERNETAAFSLRHKGDRLFAGQSDFQKVEIYDTYAFGRLLTLDGMVVTTEKDEYVYHEMISHVAMQVHPHPRRVLIIGGGDGGVAREVLRYESVEEVVMVEIDGMVIDAAKEFLPEIASAFGNPRLKLHIEDGVQYVSDCPDGAFDVAIIDSKDPVGPAEGLFTGQFYRGVHRILGLSGIMVTQSESPSYNPSVFREIFDCHRGIYGQDRVSCYLAYIATYPSGMWSFSVSTKGGIHPLQNLDTAKSEAFAMKHQLKYYNPEIHRAAFALPGFVKELLHNPELHE
jgi:spermidine synthase